MLKIYIANLKIIEMILSTTLNKGNNYFVINR